MFRKLSGIKCEDGEGIESSSEMLRRDQSEQKARGVQTLWPVALFPRTRAKLLYSSSSSSLPHGCINYEQSVCKTGWISRSV